MPVPLKFEVISVFDYAEFLHTQVEPEILDTGCPGQENLQQKSARTLRVNFQTAAYRKWSRDESESGRAARDLIIDRARLAPGMSVLDVGSAHGEPGIGIAESVGPSGRATLVDIASDLLEIA